MAGGRERATQPEYPARFFAERANACDAEGFAAPCGPEAVPTFPPGRVAVEREEIRAAYERLPAKKPHFAAPSTQKETS